MDYKYCPQCGKKLAIDVRFCPNCGTKQPLIDSSTNGSTTRTTGGHSVQEKTALNKVKSTSKQETSAKIQSREEYKSESSALNRETNDQTGSGPYSHKQENNHRGVDNFKDSQNQKHDNATVNNAGSADQTGPHEQFYQQVPNNDSINSSSPNQNVIFSNTTWLPYNQSGRPGLINSFNIWLKLFRNTNGCMGRADFWWGYLAFIILYWLIIFCVAVGVLAFDSSDNVTALLAGPGNVIFWISTFIFNLYGIVATVERLHDTGHSGWNYCWSFTGIGSFYVLYLLVQPTNWNEKRWRRTNG